MVFTTIGYFLLIFFDLGLFLIAGLALVVLISFELSLLNSVIIFSASLVLISFEVRFIFDFTKFSTVAIFYSCYFGEENTTTVYSATHTFPNAGTYNVSLFINDGCSYDTTPFTITVNPSPFVDFISSPDSVCVNELFQFDNLSVGLASTEWDFGDGGTSILNSRAYAYTATGTTQFTVSEVG